MINTNPTQLDKPFKEMAPGLQFITFLAVFVGVFVLSYLVGVLAVFALYGGDTLNAIAHLNLAGANAINAMWVIQVVGTTFPILAAPVLFAFVIMRQPQGYLKLSEGFPWVLLVLVFCIMFISSPLIEILSNINQKMSLPGFLKGLQEWMKHKEDETRDLELALFKMDTVWSMIKALVIVGLLTAIAEEFMFRGVIQNILTKWMKNPHVAIWVTAMLFSAIHLQFFGFLPRMMLGVLFGYFVLWSGSIWTSVWGHFINNGTAVVVTYLFQHKKVSFNPDDQHLFNYTGYIISLVIVLFLLYVYRTISLTPKPVEQD
ncbi:MAG: CPBP family intramembrane glutamic endopeptidase [Mucilaginibacter sp.]